MEREESLVTLPLKTGESPLLGEAGSDARAEKTYVRKPDPDLDLVERAREGDTRAFDELVVKYTPKLYGLVYHMTSNREDTNDILQDVFSKAYRALRRFKGKSSFYTWIYSITTNMTLNFLKKRNRRRALSLEAHALPQMDDAARLELPVFLLDAHVARRFAPDELLDGMHHALLGVTAQRLADVQVLSGNLYRHCPRKI